MPDANIISSSSICTDGNWSQPYYKTTSMGIIEYCEYAGQYGEPKPTIVTLHGAMGGYDQSRILAQTIVPDGYKCVAISRPGYLGTPLNSGKSPEAQADLIAMLLTELKINKACVVAISGGGPAAIFLAHRHPKLCTHLILASTCATCISTPIPFSFKIMQTLARVPFVVKKIEKKLRANWRDAAARSISNPDILKRTLNTPETKELFKATLLSTAHKMKQRLDGTQNDIQISRTYDYPLEDLKQPILVIHGKHDQHVPYNTHVGEFERRLQNRRILALAEGEHVAIFTHREEVQKAVKEFLLETMQ